jgi:hypothetical protein
VFRGGADPLAMGEVEMEDTARAAEGSFDPSQGSRCVTLHDSNSPHLPSIHTVIGPSNLTNRSQRSN